MGVVHFKVHFNENLSASGLPLAGYGGRLYESQQLLGWCAIEKGDRAAIPRGFASVLLFF